MKYIKNIAAEATYNLRKEVLRKNIDLPYTFDGDLNEETLHLGAFKEEVHVGVVTFMKSDFDKILEDNYQLRGMATTTEVRGEGFGNLLISEGIHQLQQKNIKNIWCNAREIAVGFYQKNGFKIISKPFDVPKVGVHYKMVRSI